MFDDKILDKIFSDPESQNIPIGYQSAMVHIMEKVLEEMGVDVNALHESKLL